MSIWRKRRQDAEKQEPPQPNPRLKELWSSVYFSHMNCIDEDEFQRCVSEAHAARMARIARNIADAALAEYEDRWGI